MKMVSEFTPPSPLRTPVLFLVFNRLDTTKKVFEAIKKAKPPRLYIAADGPRETKEGEAERVKAVRDYVMSNMDWECEVKTLFREKNLGCGKAVSEAITWFFENEEMGIILEDDCLPTQSFFWFCEELLIRYKHEEKIMQINGSSFLPNIDIKESYFFSKYNHIWGWASWRRAWKHFHMQYPNWEDRFEKLHSFHSKAEKEYWRKTFRKYFSGKVDTWDYPWTFSVWINHGLCVYPKLNMVRNIGFGKNATRTHEDPRGFSKLPLYEVDVKNIVHPEKVLLNEKLDMDNFKKVVYMPLQLKIVNKMRKILRRHL